MGFVSFIPGPGRVPHLFLWFSSNIFHKNRKSSQERAMELVLGLFYIIFHGESDKTTQTPWNMARTRENHNPRFFQIFSVFSRSTPFSRKKGGLKKLQKRWVSFWEVRGYLFSFFSCTNQKKQPHLACCVAGRRLQGPSSGFRGCSPYENLEKMSKNKFSQTSLRSKI